MLQMYPKRTVLGLVLMASQAFLYNSIFFTYALVVNRFFRVPEASAGWYLLGIAMGSLIGPITLGRLFDRVGRRPMITGCYAVAGIILAGTGYLFAVGLVGAIAQTALFTVTFFFASASSSAAYLTASEIFPMELTAMALGLFYAIANLLGGVTGPLIYGRLIETADPWMLFLGYLGAGGFLVLAALVELFIGVNAEQQSLEDIAAPLSAIQEETGA